MDLDFFYATLSVETWTEGFTLFLLDPKTILKKIKYTFTAYTLENYLIFEIKNKYKYIYIYIYYLISIDISSYFSENKSSYIYIFACYFKSNYLFYLKLSFIFEDSLFFSHSLICQ